MSQHTFFIFYTDFFLTLGYLLDLNIYSLKILLCHWLNLVYLVSLPSSYLSAVADFALFPTHSII